MGEARWVFGSIYRRSGDFLFISGPLRQHRERSSFQLRAEPRLSSYLAFPATQSSWLLCSRSCPSRAMSFRVYYICQLPFLDHDFVFFSCFRSKRSGGERARVRQKAREIDGRCSRARGGESLSQMWLTVSASLRFL